MLGLTSYETENRESGQKLLDEHGDGNYAVEVTSRCQRNPSIDASIAESTLIKLKTNRSRKPGGRFGECDVEIYECAWTWMEDVEGGGEEGERVLRKNTYLLLGCLFFREAETETLTP